MGTRQDTHQMITKIGKNSGTKSGSPDQSNSGSALITLFIIFVLPIWRIKLYIYIDPATIMEVTPDDY